MSFKLETKSVILADLSFYQKVFFKYLVLYVLQAVGGAFLEKPVDHFDRVNG